MQVPGIGSWLVKREFLTPAKEAVVDSEKRLSYRELNRRVNRLANALLGLGLRNGDRMAILSYNRLEFVEGIMAAAKLGVILVPLNWRFTATELTFILNDSGAKALLFDPDLPNWSRASGRKPLSSILSSSVGRTSRTLMVMKPGCPTPRW